MSAHPKTEPFHVETSLCIAPDNYLREAQSAVFVGLTPGLAQPLEGLRYQLPAGAQWDAGRFGELAAFVTRCEDAGAVLGFEIPAEGAPLQPFDYLCVDEVSRGTFRASNEKRHSHAWSLWVPKDGRIALRFEHGKFGHRGETFDKLSDAFFRLQAVVDGHPWEDFGDEEDRRTLLHKGQFYWSTPREKQPIPVDNFLFDTKGPPAEHNFCIAACGGQSILTWSVNGETAHRWNEDHAQSLDQLADILAGELTAQDFHEPFVEEDDADTAGSKGSPRGWRPNRVPALLVPVQGKLHVQSIYRSNDQYLVNTLLYRTAQGHEVTLEHSKTRLQLMVRAPGQRAAAHVFAKNELPRALRALAQALRGNL